MESRSFAFGETMVTAFLPETPVSVSVWSVMNGDEAAAVFEKLPAPKPALFALAVDWNRDLSPWNAPAVFGSENFSGGADAFLRDLAENIIPSVEKSLFITSCKRILAGYSLAGLFSVYAFYRTDCFAAGASLSGSLWFDGFLDYMKTQPFARKPEKFYFSLGDREKKTKNCRMQTVENATKEAADLFHDLDIPTVFCLVPGGHFNDVEKRIADGISWLLSQKNE